MKYIHHVSSIFKLLAVRPVGKQVRAREEIFSYHAVKATYLCKQLIRLLIDK